MDKQFKPLNSGEVLSVSKSNQFMIGHSTFRVQEFMNALREQMIQHGFGSVNSDKAQWFSEEGIECEVLQFGSGGWQKGTVRLYLEFSPDQSTPQTVTTPVKQATQVTAPTAPTPVTPVVEKPTPVEEISLQAEEEMIVETEATATATAEIEMAKEEESFDHDFESESDLGFDDSFDDELSIPSDNLGDDLEDEGLGFDESLSKESASESNFEVSLEEDDNGFDFGDDLGGDDLGGDELGSALGDDHGFGDDDFDLGADDFGSSNNTEGEGLGLGDVFNDESLDLNLGDDGMDDVWGEMEDL